MIVFGKEKTTGKEAFWVPMYHFKNGTSMRILAFTHRQCAKCGYAPCLILDAGEGKTKRPCCNHATKSDNGDWHEK